MNTTNTNQLYRANYNLLFISFLLVSIIFYIAFKNSKYLTITPTIDKTSKIEKNIVSVVLLPSPVLEKIKKTKNKTLKKKIVKKAIKKIASIQKEKTKVLKEITKLETIKKTQVIKKIVKQKIIPIFNTKIKDDFIAELYSILNKKKSYPKMAHRRKIEGIVEVNFTLCKNGKLKNIFIHKSCGHKILDNSALKLVSSIEFYKAIPDSVSMASIKLNIPIKYSRM